MAAQPPNTKMNVVSCFFVTTPLAAASCELEAKRAAEREMAKRKRSSSSKGSEVSRQKTTSQKDQDSSSWSKSKKKRMRRLRTKANSTDGSKKRGHDRNRSERTTNEETPSSRIELESGGSQSKRGKPSALQQSFLARLSGSRFRALNEELYTTTSASAFSRFSSRPELYEQYHEGFRHQVQQWPVNPVHTIFQWLVSKYGKSKQQQQVVVADFGCGDAELGQRLEQYNKRKKKQSRFVIHSFDLIASCDIVTACDMANLPLANHSVDVGVFCLSLMGTNLADFIREAHRVLKKNGKLVVAEVRSRFATSATDELEEFVSVLETLGFSCTKLDKSNKMFVLLELEKNGNVPDVNVTVTAKPCIYKRR